jgi:hypothetical integral membrane protein (TIGR02206 family)
MRLLGPLHLALVAAIVAAAFFLSWLCAIRPGSVKPLRFAMGFFLIADETVWLIFRYWHEGMRPSNLPLQLCDVEMWITAAACLTLKPVLVELAYFGGVTGAGMAILTPDLWSPWPSYPAVDFFVSHGVIVVAASMLVFGRVVPLRPRAVWRAFGWLQAYAAALLIVNAVTGANYMYLRLKPRHGSLLNALGPWPFYVIAGDAVALALLWLLWLAASKPRPANASRSGL